jgi:hypothetical protein
MQAISSFLAKKWGEGKKPQNSLLQRCTTTPCEIDGSLMRNGCATFAPMETTSATMIQIWAYPKNVMDIATSQCEGYSSSKERPQEGKENALLLCSIIRAASANYPKRPAVLSRPLERSQDVQTIIEANGSRKSFRAGITLQETSKTAGASVACFTGCGTWLAVDFTWLAADFTQLSLIFTTRLALDFTCRQLAS